MQDVRSYKGYDRDYANRQMVRDWLLANYYGSGQADAEEVLGFLASHLPELNSSDDLDLEEIVANAMALA